MQQFCQYGSVRGATGNRRPYRDRLIHRSGVKTVLAGRLRFLRTIAQNNKGAYVGPFVIHNFARSLIAR